MKTRLDNLKDAPATIYLVRDCRDGVTTAHITKESVAATQRHADFHKYEIEVIPYSKGELQ